MKSRYDALACDRCGGFLVGLIGGDNPHTHTTIAACLAALDEQLKANAAERERLELVRYTLSHCTSKEGKPV